MIDKYQYIRKYCDFQTKDGIWRLGIIDGKFNKDKEIIEVALDGWSNNKIQKVCIHSKRLQPPRYYSRGYTGQLSHPVRKFEIDFDQIDYIVNRIKLINNFLNFEHLNSLDITQIFRCQMFILVDAIIFYPWNLQENKLIEYSTSIENFFRSIVHFAISLLENIRKYIIEINTENYERHQYLQSIPVCFIEISYELFTTLKSIFGLTNRTQFFQQYSNNFKTDLIKEFIDLGFLNLTSLLIKNFKNIKLFTEKFYIIANFFDLYLRIHNKATHQKLNNFNKLNKIKEIINFLTKENFLEMINANKNDPDVISLVEALEEFSSNHKSFANESQMFTNFYNNISRFKKIPDTSPKNKILSQKSIRMSTPKHSNEFISKLSIIELKLSQLENKIINSRPSMSSMSTMNYTDNNKKNQEIINQNLKKTTTEFNLISPTKLKESHSNELKNTIQENEINYNLLVNPVYFPKNDAYDEITILSLLEQNLNNKNFEVLKKIIKWRKQILEICKNNGWVVAKALANNTIKKMEISDDDVIEANLIFLDKFNLINRKKSEKLYNEMNYKELLINYEKELIKSLNQ